VVERLAKQCRHICLSPTTRTLPQQAQEEGKRACMMLCRIIASGEEQAAVAIAEEAELVVEGVAVAVSPSVADEG
jgi:hypothetical protein